MLGEEAPYGAVCRNFHALAFQDENYEHSLSFQERDMIEVRVTCFIFSQYNRFLSSTLNHLLAWEKCLIDGLNCNRTWSIEVHLVPTCSHSS
jgi:hypothetical protein